VTQPVRQRVLLVSSPDDAAPPWPLCSLRDQLRLEGHEVAVTGEIDGFGESDIDVVHAFGWKAARAVAERRPRVPWVLTAPWGRSGTGCQDADVVRGADLVLCASSEDTEAANRLGVSRHRCLVLPVGVDVEVFTRLGPSACRTTSHRIVVRALGPGDGVLDVIAALPAIPSAELVILVERAAGADVEGRLRSLMKAAQDFGVRGRVAMVPASDPLGRSWLLRSADVVVSMAGVTADHGLLAEAMACGKGVVVTPTGSQRDLVVDDVTGLFVPTGRVRALALALRGLLRDPFTLQGMGLAGADRALSRFAWPRVAREFASAYARLSGRPALLDLVDDEAGIDASDAVRMNA
jgi:glycosyltransferase involved in cell wall biosynthesis